MHGVLTMDLNLTPLCDTYIRYFVGDISKSVLLRRSREVGAGLTMTPLQIFKEFTGRYGPILVRLEVGRRLLSGERRDYFLTAGCSTSVWNKMRRKYKAGLDPSIYCTEHIRHVQNVIDGTVVKVRTDATHLLQFLFRSAPREMTEDEFVDSALYRAARSYTKNRVTVVNEDLFRYLLIRSFFRGKDIIREHRRNTRVQRFTSSEYEEVHSAVEFDDSTVVYRDFLKQFIPNDLSAVMSRLSVYDQDFTDFLRERGYDCDNEEFCRYYSEATYRKLLQEHTGHTLDYLDYLVDYFRYMLERFAQCPQLT